MPRARRHGIAFLLALGWRPPIAGSLAHCDTFGGLAINLVVKRRRVVTPAAGLQ